MISMHSIIVVGAMMLLWIVVDSLQADSSVVRMRVLRVLRIPMFI
jgi:hypothetical protein